MIYRPFHRKPSQASQRRSGTVLVENAIVASVFGVFLTGIMEFGHTYMVQGVMNAAAQRAARYGSVTGVTTSQVETKAKEILTAAFRTAQATVAVKDGGVFDTTNVDPKTINYNTLQNIELNTAGSSQLFIVRISVPYNSVALLPPFWVKNVTLRAQSVMRHE